MCPSITRHAHNSCTSLLIINHGSQIRDTPPAHQHSPSLHCPPRHSSLLQLARVTIPPSPPPPHTGRHQESKRAAGTRGRAAHGGRRQLHGALDPAVLRPGGATAAPAAAGQPGAVPGRGLAPPPRVVPPVRPAQLRAQLRPRPRRRRRRRRRRALSALPVSVLMSAH
jgi:hypothetical protein